MDLIFSRNLQNICEDVPGLEVKVCVFNGSVQFAWTSNTIGIVLSEIK